ncbi:MAG TPA: DUF1579 family protein [Xanthomonadales bacterium]|nr:DUF1579 family protein [Xanthomonadales bacterium]
MLTLVAPLLLSLAAAAPSPTGRDGRHDFDFEFGEWRVHHRTLAKDGTWLEFDGTCTTRPAMDGAANVEEHVFERPAGRSHGMAIRAYDAATREWAIWWIDSRAPHLALDPPMKGRFDDDVGTFYSDAVVDGKTTRTRFLWTVIDTDHLRWEQSLSTDAGATWATNWIMTFIRINQGDH